MCELIQVDFPARKVVSRRVIPGWGGNPTVRERDLQAVLKRLERNMAAKR